MSSFSPCRSHNVHFGIIVIWGIVIGCRVNGRGNWVSVHLFTWGVALVREGERAVVFR